MIAAACALATGAEAKKAAAVSLQKDLVYATTGGVALKFDIARPPDGTGPFPLLLFIHAGGWQLGDKKSFDEDLPGWANRGYVAATVNYRLAPNFKWPAQVEDLQAAVRYFRSHAIELGIDPARIGVIGDDAGGHLGLMLGLLSAQQEKDAPLPQSSRIQAVVNFFGPTDLREWRVTSGWVETKIRIGFFKSSEQIIEDFLGTRDRTAPIYADVSPILHVTPDAPPVLTIIGSKDPLISVAQPTAFHEALKKAGVTEELVVVEGAEHDWDSFKREGSSDARLYEFFDKYLKGTRGGE